MPGIAKFLSMLEQQKYRNWHVRDAKEVTLLSAAIIGRLAPSELAPIAELMINHASDIEEKL